MLRFSYLPCWFMVVILRLVSVVGGGSNVLSTLNDVTLICVMIWLMVFFCRKFVRFFILGSLGMGVVCYLLFIVIWSI